MSVWAQLAQRKAQASIREAKLKIYGSRRDRNVHSNDSSNNNNNSNNSNDKKKKGSFETWRWLFFFFFQIGLKF